MANEKATDLIVAAKLKAAGIPFYPNGSSIPEIKKALKSASKKGCIGANDLRKILNGLRKRADLKDQRKKS